MTRTDGRADADERRLPPILAELGLETSMVGDEVHGEAAVTPEMSVPGTTCIRASVLAIWADTVAGLAAVRALAPSVPVTLELDVHLYREPRGVERVRAVGEVIKAGRSVVVLSVEFTAEDGDPLAVANASFMGAPDLPRTMSLEVVARRSSALSRSLLRVPLAERARCTRPEAGVATVPRSDDGLNAANSLNGGLLALAVEEAVLSLASPGRTLSSIALRYLRPVRVGPAVAIAELRDGLGRARVRDAGEGDRLAVIATTRAFAG